MAALGHRSTTLSRAGMSIFSSVTASVRPIDQFHEAARSGNLEQMINLALNHREITQATLTEALHVLLPRPENKNKALVLIAKKLMNEVSSSNLNQAKMIFNCFKIIGADFTSRHNRVSPLDRALHSLIKNSIQTNLFDHFRMIMNEQSHTHRSSVADMVSEDARAAATLLTVRDLRRRLAAEGGAGASSADTMATPLRTVLRDRSTAVDSNTDKTPPGMTRKLALIFNPDGSRMLGSHFTPTKGK